MELLNKNESHNIYLTLVFIYINQVFPSYDPSLLYYIYTKFYKKDAKNFFISFLNCLNEKENKSNITGHLFLEKYENINNNHSNKFNITKLSKNWEIKKNSIKRFVLKNLINLNYSKNSFFYEYIDKKIEKAIEKNKLKKIDYILFYYTSDKNKALYEKFIDKFIQSKIPFYLFLEYDKEINNEQSMIKIIKILDNLTKNTFKYSVGLDYTDDPEEKDKSLFEEEICYYKRHSSSVEKELEDKIMAEEINDIDEEYKFISKHRKDNFIKFLKRRKLIIKLDKTLREKVRLSNKYYISENKIINLYTFFSAFKKENKNLINIINNNYVFLRETLKILLNYITGRHYHSNIKGIENKEQKEFLDLQIFEFFKSIYANNINNELLVKYFEYPINFDKYKYKIRLLRFFENTFIQKIQSLNSKNIPDIEYQPYKQILTKFCNYTYKNGKIFKKTLLFLFAKDIGKLMDFLDINTKIEGIETILNNYSKSLVNKNITKTFEEYFPIYYNFKSLYLEKKIFYPSDLELWNLKDLNNIYFTLVFIYINQVYPLYDPSLLYYIYRKNYKNDSKKFFITFIECITEKENQSNIPAHLFIDKYETLDDINNNKFDITKLTRDWGIKKSSLKKFILKHLISLNYSKNSFFYEYVDKKIKKALQNQDLKKIDYIIYYYSSDKNKELYDKLVDKFIQLKIPFYSFLEYDKEINNEQNMKNLIILLDNLTKTTAQYSNDFEKSENKEEEENVHKTKYVKRHWNNWREYDDIENKIMEEKLSESDDDIFYRKTKRHIREDLFEVYKRRKVLIKKDNKSREDYLNDYLKYNKNVTNIIVNLYSFFKILKNENKKLIDIINNNFIFLKETITVLIKGIKLILYDSRECPDINTIKDKNQNEFLTSQIYEFFKSLFEDNNTINNEHLEKYFENPFKLQRIEHIIKLVQFFENTFIKRNKELSENIPDKEYQPYKQIVIKFCEFYNEDAFRKTLVFLFEKDIQKFFDFLKLDFFNIEYHIKIFTITMQKNLNKFLGNSEIFDFISNDKMKSPKIINMNKNIIKYILNHAKIDQYSNLDFINNSMIFKDLNSSLNLLNSINNQQASIFIINKIQQLFEEINTNTKLFLELIKRQINNNYVFDFLFNSFNEVDISELFQNNKNLIIISLYKYLELNSFQYIQISIEHLSKYIEKDELKNLICPNFVEYSFPDYINEFFEERNKIIEVKKDNPDEELKEELEIKKEEKRKRKKKKEEEKKNEEEIRKYINKYNNPFDNINKYLLFHALQNKKINNYETIALLLEHCNHENGIYNFYAFLTDDFQNLNTFKIMEFIEYFSNDSNKQKIKAIGNNLYKFIELFEKTYRFSNNDSKLNSFEKTIFNNYKLIFIFDIIPEKLVKFLGIVDKNNLNMDIISQGKEKKAISSIISEKELFIILSLYEIKGIPVLPIKKYIPKFYSEILKSYTNFEKLEIPKISFKKEFDTKFHEHFLYLIKNKTIDLINSICYPRFKNLILILQNEYLPNSELSIDTYESIDKLILDLIMEENIAPFYNNNENDEFFTNLRNIEFLIVNNGIREKIRLKNYLDNPTYNFNIEETDTIVEKRQKEKNRHYYWRYGHVLGSKKRKNKFIEKINEIIEKNHYNEEEIIHYKTIIYSLLDFHQTSNYILQNHSNLMEKYGFKDKTFLNIYTNYLEIVIELYHYISNKDENDIYYINILEEYNITPNIENKLRTMKNNINLNKITQEIIKAFENSGLNKNVFFEPIQKWINNYINSNNEIMNEYKKISEEKISIFSYFKYLSLNCFILLKAIETFNQIKEFLEFSNISLSLKELDYPNYYYFFNDYFNKDELNKYILELKIDFIFSKDKKTSKQNSGDSLFKFAKNFVNQINQNNYNPNNKNYKFEGNLIVYFYFNEEKEIFYETCSNNDLKEFVLLKCSNIKKFIGSIIAKKNDYMLEKETNKIKYINELLFINNKLNEKDLYSIIIENILSYDLEIKDETQKNKILNIFNPILEENQNLIASYFKNTIDNMIEPDYFNCLNLIRYKFDKLIFNSLDPCISLNFKLNKICLDEKYLNRSFYSSKHKKCFLYYSFLGELKLVNGKCLKYIKNYTNYINLNEIISSIMNTKYHVDTELNSLFQIKAINYIINDNSYFSNFIIGLYFSLFKNIYQKNYENIDCESFKEKINIDEKFDIKITEGKKYSKKDFDILKKKQEEKIKKISEEIKNKNKNDDIRALKSNEKIQYKLCKYDTDFKYDRNYFPFKSIYCLNGKEIKPQGFNNYNYNNYINNNIQKKHNFSRINNFINVYDLIFTVKNIDKNNVITIEKNDISVILEPYSEKEIFNSLLNESFSYKTEEETNIDITPIKFYLENKNK